MRRRNCGALGLLGLGWMLGGCGPAEIVPMTPPGVPYQRVVTDTMDAEGESKARGTIAPANVTPNGEKPTPATGPSPSPTATNR